MKKLIHWYFEQCRISGILLAGTLIWIGAACLMLGEIAPAVYVGLHLVTTGLFTVAIIRASRNDTAKATVNTGTHEPAESSVPHSMQKQSA